MPCESGPVDTSCYQNEIDRLTRLLCSVCKKLESKNLGSLISKVTTEKNEKLGAWWKEHQEEDRRREAEEKREADEERAKQKVLKKLTAKERRLLQR